METRIAAVEELSCWLLSARPGDRFVYATGPAMLPGPTQALIADLLEAERVRTHQRPAAGGGGREHFLVLREPPRAPIEPAPAPPADPAIETIFAALRRCARAGKRAYSDLALARIAGLATRNQAAWRVRRLAEAKRIAIETVPGPDGPWRIVTIGGHATAAPPGAALGRAAPEKGGVDG